MAVDLRHITAACLLLTELDWVQEVLRRDGTVSASAAVVLLGAADEPDGLGPFASLVQQEDVDAILGGLAAGGASSTVVERAELMAAALRPVADAAVNLLEPDARLDIQTACRLRLDVLDQLDASTPVSNAGSVQIEFVLQATSADGNAELTRALADEIEAALGFGGEVVGSEWHAGRREITLQVEGADADVITMALIPLVRSHAGSGSYYEVHRAGRSPGRHLL